MLSITRRQMLAVERRFWMGQYLTRRTRAGIRFRKQEKRLSLGGRKRRESSKKYRKIQKNFEVEKMEINEATLIVSAQKKIR